MAGTGDVDNASGSRPRGFGSILQLRHKQIGKKKMANVIRSKLDFDSFLRGFSIQDHHAGIVDKCIDSID
jgi:hypothetical protein